MQKSKKKIKPARPAIRTGLRIKRLPTFGTGEIFHSNLISSRSLAEEELNNLKFVPAQTAPSEWLRPGGLDFLTAEAENF